MTESMPAAATTPSSDCCRAPDAATQSNCKICQAGVCGNCQASVNEQTLCARCKEQVLAELSAEAHVPPEAIGMGLVGGLVAAAVGGAAWLAVIVATNSEIGFLAIFVGWLAGLGVHIGSGRKRGATLQWIALACCLLGILLGKLFMFSYFAVKQGVASSYFEPELLQFFPDFLIESSSFFDLLWIAIAIPSAWRAVKPEAVRVEG